MAGFNEVVRGGKSHESGVDGSSRHGRMTRRPFRSPRAAIATAVAPGLERLESRVLMAAVRPDAAFTAVDLGIGDDRSFPTTGSAGYSLGFSAPINFFGSLYNGVFINNNGNVSLGARNSFYSDVGLESLPARVIAPFYANVDTRFDGLSARYGRGAVDGRSAFGVTWLDADYYPSNAAHVNSNRFQLVLVDRSDLGAGNFDIEFNYDSIKWESGSTSGGDANGLGGRSARIGWTANNGTLEGIHQMEGSGVAGTFLDSNLETGLVHGSFMSDVAGRYLYRFRDGIWADAPTGAVNTAPVVNLPAVGTLVEGPNGSTYLDLAGSFEDPDADSWTATVDFGDGWGAQTLGLDGAKGFLLQNPYYAAGSHTVTVTIDDGNGGVGVGTMNLMIEDRSAPVVTVLAPQLVRENEAAVFTASLAGDTDANDFYTFEWTGSGVGQDGAFDFHAADNGSYIVSVKVTDPSGNFTIVDVPVTVENVAPTATGLSGAGALDEGGTLALSLDGAGDLSPVDLAAGLLYSFDFDGDGVFEISGLSPLASHLFDDSGTYLVRARVTDKDGGSSDYSATVYVANVAPTSAGLSGPATGDEGQALTFSLGAASDLSGADAAAGFTYGFDFDGDGIFEVSGASSVVAHVFDDNGNYTVRARVSDKDGGYADYSHEVKVKNVPPKRGWFVDNNPIAEGSLVTVSFEGQEDPSGADTAAGFTYSFDFDGDGVFEISGSSPSATHAYLDNGVFAVTGRVNDKDGGYTDYVTDVEVYNVAPTATVTAANAVEGSNVVVRLDGVSDPSAADRAAGMTYRFDLDNDGVYEVVGSSPSASRLFKQDGTYTVHARVTDKDGGSTDYTTSVVVANAAPVVTGFGNTASTLGRAEAGSVVSFNASFTDAGVLDRHTATVDWGDGSSGMLAASPSNGSGTGFGLHSYKQGGIYTVTLKVSDDASPAGVVTATSQVFITGVGLQNGVVQVVGTNSDDRVSVTNDNRGGIKVKTSFARDAVFSSTSFREIRATLGNGRDRFEADAGVTQPMYVNGVRYVPPSRSRGAYGSIANSLFSDRLVA